MHDIALALMADQARTTDVLSVFPTKAATEPTPETVTEGDPERDALHDRRGVGWCRRQLRLRQPPDLQPERYFHHPGGQSLRPRRVGHPLARYRDSVAHQKVTAWKGPADSVGDYAILLDNAINVYISSK